MSFADFMALALYHPTFGYYCQKDFAIGREGDFVTAPELSPLFAMCLAKPCQQLIEHARDTAILELGAGTGRLALELLCTLHASNASPKHYYIYEMSEHLREAQRTLIAAHKPAFLKNITWLTVLPAHFKGMIIANEVLDAIPVHCFCIEENNKIQERYITINACSKPPSPGGGGLRWRNQDRIHLTPEAMVPPHPSHHPEGEGGFEQTFIWHHADPHSQVFDAEIKRLQTTYALPTPYASEINLNLVAFIQQLSTMLTEGILLFADYGYGEREYYHPAHNLGTLTCFYKHHHHDNPLLLPGKQDITAHVNFTRIAELATTQGLALSGYTSQTAFLLDCGLLQLAEEKQKHLTAAQIFEMNQAIKTLTWPTEMGERIKMIALNKNCDLPLLGFRSIDYRRML
ncbi:MAG: hypothetical protein A3F43_06885 [Gammaproteobacteria bacterium RIFCSPHIGHO2_12_FULL_42_10]|nr:MAG: hypothetical protein A3F43_06885 [Gammaproteobacteria bacterium RIFCSPHIGHO2_12_FULL_42_10]